MWQHALALAELLLLALACTARAQGQQPPDLKKTVLFKNLADPWDAVVTPGGDLLYTDKCEGLYIAAKAQSGAGYDAPVHLLGPNGSKAALEAPDFFCEGQTGANGVEVDPDFANNGFIYIFMPSAVALSAASPRPYNHVVRLKLDVSSKTVGDRVDIVKDVLFKAKANPWGPPGSHSGGRIRFGPDGYLYVTTGDNHNGTLPQDLTALGGKVLRVDRNGTAAPGNQTPPPGDPRIYTYGHRNVQVSGPQH
jgi:aldose sugar dehydrogenase